MTAHTMLHSLACCAAALSLAPAALSAPNPAPRAVQGIPSKEEMEQRRRELEEMKRINDELMRRAEREAIDAESTLARLGGSKPWPPPDPEFATDSAWREAVLSAEGVSASELLATAKVLRIQVSRSPQVAEMFGDDQSLMIEAVAAVHRAKRRTHPDNLLTIRFAASTTGANEVFVEARLTLPARLLRGEDVHHAELELAHFVDLHACAGSVTREDVAVGFDRALAGLFAVAAASTAAPLGDDAWTRWLAAEAVTTQRRAAFAAAARGADELTAGLDGLRGFSGVDVDVLPAAGEDDDLSQRRGERLRAHWAGLLEAGQLAGVVPDAPRLVHGVRWTGPGESEPNASEIQTQVFSARLGLREGACLANVDGRWVRVAGDSWSIAGPFDVNDSRAESHVPLEPWIQSSLENSATAEFEVFRRARERGTRPPVAPHPDGPAVANFLRTRTRVDVPESVLIDFSNLIARTLAEAPGIPASLRAEWTVQIDGQTQLYLPYVGGARSGTSISRSVQAAVRAAIDRILLDDPMAGIAFYDIWMHDRGYRRPDLPAGFAEELRRSRPAGAGALRNVAVVDAYEYAFKRLTREGAPRGGTLEKSVDALRPQLVGKKVLECEYIPEDKSTSYTLVRTFWYQSAPSEWAAIAANLPQDFPLGSTGPARAAAPRTLAEADRALGL